MLIRVVVADRAEARYYDLASPDAPLRPVATLTNPKGRLHDRDLKSDRPGRAFDRTPSSGQRRGAVARHATGTEQSPQEHESEAFARRIVRDLESAAHEKRFERLVLVAGPAFLGLLRAALPKKLKAIVAGEIDKDLIHEPDEALRSHLPPEAFRP